jgi:pimeloyl-ACP methyl ester carboxylesterase
VADDRLRPLTVDTADGRRLDVLVTGPADGMPLVFHYGTPSGLVPLRPLIEAATARGLRTVMYSRPGYGGSTPQPGRCVADAADDVLAILHALDAAVFVTAGWSGGGPHALACAARLPGRCLAAASVAGVAPYHAEGLDWMDGMGAENCEEFGAAVSGEAVLSAYLVEQAADLAQVAGPEVAEAFGDLVSSVDRAVLTADFADFLAEALRSALTAGIGGWRDDDLAFVRPWGFSLAEIGAAAIWQGGQDRMVPYAHGVWLGRQVPGARAHLLPGAGHLTLAATGWAEILAELAVLAAG